jgi:hypothetical protein
MLNVYVEGARDSDAMLGDLRDYFSAQDEPVVLVFFGDHLPYLGDNQVGYAELGMTAEPYWDELGSYQTPFVIWANNTAYDMLDWSSVADLPDTISASFLGAAVTELTGHTTSWFSFLNELRQDYPVVNGLTTVSPDGTVLSFDTTELNRLENIQKWRQWSYYKLKYQEFSR